MYQLLDYNKLPRIVSSKHEGDLEIEVTDP